MKTNGVRTVMMSEMKGKQTCSPFPSLQMYLIDEEKNGKPNKTKRNKINFMSNLKSATPFIVSLIRGSGAKTESRKKKLRQKRNTQVFVWKRIIMKDVKNVCCNSVCVFSLHQFTHSMNVASEGTNTKECGSCSLGCRNRRKEGKKNCENWKESWYRTKSDLSAWKLDYKFKHFFPRFSYHFGINSILVNWMLLLLDEHVWASMSFPSQKRARSLFLTLLLSICLFFSLFVRTSLVLFVSVVCKNLYRPCNTKRTHNINSNVFRKKQKKKHEEKTFPIKIILAVVITMLLNSPNQNLLEKILHLNYWAWLVCMAPLKLCATELAPPAPLSVMLFLSCAALYRFLVVVVTF